MGIIYGLARFENVILMSVSLACLGGSIIPVISMGYSYGSELSYPIGAGLSCGVL